MEKNITDRGIGEGSFRTLRAYAIKQGAMLGRDAQTAPGVVIRTSQGHAGNVPMPPKTGQIQHLVERSLEWGHPPLLP